jgi:hypothetical protein
MDGMFPKPLAPAPYPLDAFLVIVREAGFELIRNVQAPDAMVGMALINAVSMACQGLIDVKLPMGQVRPVSQNLLVVAESGERKSTVASLLLAPFREADMEAITSHGSKRARYQAELEGWQARNKSLRRAINKAMSKGSDTTALEAELVELANLKPREPRLRYFLRQDITAKAIMEAVQGNGESIAITTDEGHVLFQSAAMSQVGLLNALWDSAEVLPLDRAGKEPILALNPRVSVSIMTQKAPLQAYLEKRGSVAKGSGHWARYLVGWPASTQGYRWVHPSEQVWEHLPSFHARISELLAQYRTMIESERVNREIIEFSDDAKARWFELAAETERLLREGEYFSDINDFASKVMEILARLAAAMHHFSGEVGKIPLDTLERGFAIIRWHVEEYKHLFSPQFVVPQDQIDAQALAKYLRFHIWGGPASDTFVPKNQLRRNGPVRDKARLNDALQLLVAQRAIDVGMAPKDKKSYVRLLNPFFGSM